MARVLHETDGVVTFDAAEYHPEAAAAFRKWFAETGRSVYFSGPLVPPVRPSVERTADLLAFLDRQLASRGERSVIYISFGSLFWPSDPAKFAAVLGVLMGRNIPFVLTRPSPFTSFPDHTKAALATYDKAYIADWVPQQAVLHHAATGWCLTHGGHNSVLECILAEVPMILWPVVVDQPTNAIYLAELVGVAYELIEVRHGSGLGTIYRTGRTPSGTLEAVKTEFGDVLDRAFGEDGEEKRLRLRTFKRTLEKAWMEDGVTRREVQDFVSSIV